MQVEIQEKRMFTSLPPKMKNRSLSTRFVVQKFWAIEEILYKGKEMKGKADHSSHGIKTSFESPGSFRDTQALNLV